MLPPLKKGVMKKGLLSIGMFILFSPMLYAYPIYPKPLTGGEITSNTTFEYIFNFTTSNDCTGVVLSNRSIITTRTDGIGFIDINISGLTNTPRFICEYRNGTLRTVHNVSDQIFNELYVRQLNFSTFLYGTNANIINNATIGEANITTNAYVQNTFTISSITLGSILFATTDGRIAQNNAAIRWNDTLTTLYVNQGNFTNLTINNQAVCLANGTNCRGNTTAEIQAASTNETSLIPWQNDSNTRTNLKRGFPPQVNVSNLTVEQYAIFNISNSTDTYVQNNLTLQSMTNQSIPFIGPNGLLIQDDSNLTWENTNKILTTRGSFWSTPLGGGMRVINSGTAGAAVTVQSTDAGGAVYSLLSTGSTASGGAGNFVLYSNNKSTYRWVSTLNNYSQLFNTLSTNANGQDVLMLGAAHTTTGSGANLDFTNAVLTGITIFGQIRTYTEATNQTGILFSTYNGTLNPAMYIGSNGSVNITQNATINNKYICLSDGTNCQAATSDGSGWVVVGPYIINNSGIALSEAVLNRTAGELTNFSIPFKNTTTSEIHLARGYPTNFNLSTSNVTINNLTILVNASISGRYVCLSDGTNCRAERGNTTEEVQDAFGSLLSNSSTVNLAYDDATNIFSAYTVSSGGSNETYIIPWANASNVLFLKLGFAQYVNLSSSLNITGGLYVNSSKLVVNDSGVCLSGDCQTSWTNDTFNTSEEMQDAVGTALTDTVTVDFTYDDAGNAISAVSRGNTTAEVQTAANLVIPWINVSRILSVKGSFADYVNISVLNTSGWSSFNGSRLVVNDSGVCIYNRCQTDWTNDTSANETYLIPIGNDTNNVFRRAGFPQSFNWTGNATVTGRFTANGSNFIVDDRDGIVMVTNISLRKNTTQYYSGFDFRESQGPSVILPVYQNGIITITPSSNQYNFSLPLEIPHQFAGSSVTLEEVTIYYAVTGNAIDRTKRLLIMNPGNATFINIDNNGSRATGQTNYTFQNLPYRIDTDMTTQPVAIVDLEILVSGGVGGNFDIRGARVIWSTR